MSDEKWFAFFAACARVLGPGYSVPTEHGSWCAWTTFRSLQNQVHYWAAGLPLESELGPTATTDGGTWGQPFHYREFAHVIIPREVYWEEGSASSFRNGSKFQDINRLSSELTAAEVPHRLTELVVEVKLY
ncbi:hypothetical protein [Methylibium sp. Root1272]|uniref:hypothetical protein n=1 Tax=Methylibium sp. Root1272 TaxID=1736441 RepID=UPI0006F6552A|nr:hypothetical protein [Methylibium sp. Root1272]KQW72491.1 hypothetical protein ASC67_19985 [Methylibium sp. Root1272]